MNTIGAKLTKYTPTFILGLRYRAASWNLPKHVIEDLIELKIIDRRRIRPRGKRARERVQQRATHHRALRHHLLNVDAATYQSPGHPCMDKSDLVIGAQQRSAAAAV